MSLFDIFRGGSKGAKGDKKSNSASKWADVAGNKRAQSYERQEAIEALAQLANADAAEALLKRFTFMTDPSITDQEEKESAFQGVLRAGREAIPVVRVFAQKAESLAWPMRIMKNLMSEEEFVDEIIAWLARWDTEYSKFVDPKLQLLTALQEHESPKIRAAVEKFMEDVSDDARYATVAVLVRQRDAACVPALAKAFVVEESMRVKNRILDGMAGLGWSMPVDNLDAVRGVVPGGYSVGADGAVTKFG